LEDKTNLKDMMIPWGYGSEKTPESYKSYKGKYFNRKVEKQRQLLNSILESSLKTADKELLKKRLLELF
jgi:hypothetical protein